MVHINAGIAALVSALVIGRRKNLDRHSPAPHNLPFIVLGTGLLWFGWFGFNAGSALAANGLAVNAFVVTNTAAAAAGLSWALIEWFHNGKPTMFRDRQRRGGRISRDYPGGRLCQRDTGDYYRDFGKCDLFYLGKRNQTEIGIR